MGSETLSSLAALLKANETIRLIDLEGNKLIKGERDAKPNYKGIDDLVDALKEN